MSVTERRSDAGRSTGSEIVAAVLHELKTARRQANLSQAAVARRVGWSQTRYSLFERNVDPIRVEDVCLVAVVLGLRPRLELHRVEEGVRDWGHTRLIARFRGLLSPAWDVVLEAPFPFLGDLRSWDVFMRLTGGTRHRTGVEAETRVRDQQELVRRVRQRELHGGADTIVVILTNSVHNRAALPELLAALGPAFATSPGTMIAALRAGQPLPGSGVILL